jgi:hypothetical protein
MEDINTRLSTVITALKMSKNKFSKEIGTSSAMISKITGTKTNFGIEIVEKIVSRFPQLNFNWILTGVGEMWLDNHNYEAQEHPQLSKNSSNLNSGKIDGKNSVINALEDDNRGNILQVIEFWNKMFSKDKELEKTVIALNELESLKIDLSIFIEKLNKIPNEIQRLAQNTDSKELMSEHYINEMIKKLAPLKKYHESIDQLNSLITSVLIFLEDEN